MSLAVSLQKNYTTCRESGLVGNWEQADESAVLLPIYHSNLRAQKNQVFLIQLDRAGHFVQGNYLEENETIIFPVTENSVSRTRASVSRPLVDELQYLVPVSHDKQGLYLAALSDWLEAEKNPIVKEFLSIVYQYVSSGSLITDMLPIIASGNSYQYDDDNQELTLEIMDRDKVKLRKISLKKTIIEFEIIDFHDRKNWRVSTSSELQECFIRFQEEKNKQLPQELCSITGRLMYCATTHRGMMGNAKIIGVSNHPENYVGRFKKGSDVVKVGYKTSNEVHNMLKYLLESKNTSARLSYKKGQSGADPSVLLTWFSDDVTNQRQTNPTQPARSLNTLALPEEDSDYLAGGKGTKNVLHRARGFDLKINPSAKVYLMILDKASNGRISIKYFRESNQGPFYARMADWYDSFRWYFYDKESKKYTPQSPSLIKLVDTVFGVENELGSVSIADAKNKFKENWLTNLIPCVTEGKRIPLGLVQQAIENIKNRQRYINSWETVMAVGLAVLRKYHIDYKGERKEVMLDTANIDRSYLYGRVLALLEYLEQQSLRSQRGDDSKGIRQTNAERFWNNYLRAPAKTMNFLIQRGKPYWDRIRKNSPQLFIRAHKELENCINLLGEVEGDMNKNRALNEDFIFGYYAQRHALYQSKSELSQETNNMEEENETV